MGSVLDMLNIINGILFVQISQQDIETFKKEYELRQKDGVAPSKKLEIESSSDKTENLLEKSPLKTESPQNSSPSPSIELS